MIVGDNRTRATRRLAAALRWGGAVAAVGALAGLGLVNAPGPARADNTTSGYDQMSGIGDTPSAVKDISWVSGLLDSNNKPVQASPAGELNTNAERACGTGSAGTNCPGAGPTSFMDSDFSSLSVTVSQTQDIGHGGVTVTWNWPGHETQEAAGIQGNYLQIMECHGNAPTGPSPEDCEFGQGVLPSGAPPQVGTRQGDLCTSQTIDVDHPDKSLNGDSPAFGCDAYEPGTEGPTHYPCTTDPKTGAEVGPDCLPDGFSVPFVPADGGSTLYQGELNQAFDQFSTNEVDFATTRSDFTGQQQFETLTSVQSSGLGCGQPQSDGTPQGCWLVIVPRGSHEPNAYQASITVGESGPNNTIESSPLSAVNWAQRIQVHLAYAALPKFCPLGGVADESLMEGTQLVNRAVQSWELKLNEDANCSRLYHLASTSEQQVTSDFVTPLISGVAANALAFTTDPIGTDRVRNGEPPPTLPNIVYAPVAIMAIDFGFHIDEFAPLDTTHTQGYIATAINLSPQLVARALTQSYRLDLPDYDVHESPPLPGPAWSQDNPPDLSHDPTFQQLNQKIIPHGFSAIPLAPLDTIDHSSYYQQLWQWLQGDPSTAAWLNGTANPTDPTKGVTVNPAYSAQALGAPPAVDSVPRSYPACLDLGISDTGKPEKRCSIDMLPYVANFDAASADVLAANPQTYGDTWDPTAVAPDGTVGYWAKNPAEPSGQAFIWTIDATPFLAGYGIIPAALCDDVGNNCITPTVASVGAAVANAKPDSQGLLEVNPASPGTGAFPLTEVIYAAVRTDATPQELTDYADLISFAANQGQTAGQAGGDLPSGYLPLTASLKAQANAAVTQLRQIAGGGPTSTATPTASTSPSSPASTPTGGPSTAGPAGNGAAQPTTATPTTPAASVTPSPNPGTSASSTASAPAGGATPTGPVIVPPTIAIAPAGNTPSEPPGPIRNVLVAVVITGIAGAGGGILLRRGRMPRWPGRRLP